MRILLLIILLSLMVSVIARSRGRPALFYFALSMLLSPLVGLLALFLFPAGSRSSVLSGRHPAGAVPCFSCRNSVPVGSRVCPSCGKPQPEIIDAEVLPNADPAAQSNAGSAAPPPHP